MTQQQSAVGGRPNYRWIPDDHERQQQPEMKDGVMAAPHLLTGAEKGLMALVLEEKEVNLEEVAGLFFRLTVANFLGEVAGVFFRLTVANFLGEAVLVVHRPFLAVEMEEDVRELQTVTKSAKTLKTEVSKS